MPVHPRPSPRPTGHPLPHYQFLSFGTIFELKNSIASDQDLGVIIFPWISLQLVTVSSSKDHPSLPLHFGDAL